MAYEAGHMTRKAHDDFRKRNAAEMAKAAEAKERAENDGEIVDGGKDTNQAKGKRV